MQNYTYSIFSILAIAIHFIINFNLLAKRRTVAEYGLHYRNFLNAVLAYYLSDAAWGVIAGFGWTRALYVDTIFFFLSLPVFCFMWCRFVLSYLSLGPRTRRVLLGYGYALLAVNVALLVANAFNNCIFYFDANGTYLFGSLRYLPLELLFAYYVIISVAVFAKALREHDSVRRRGMIVFLFGVLVAAAIILQVVWPLTPFTSLACLVGNCFLHVFVVQDEQTARHMDELKNALVRACAAERARSHFFSVVSHDIRTPLNAILGYSELLLKGGKSQAETYDALRTIHASGVTLMRLVNDVLDLAKMNAGKMSFNAEPVKLSRLTDDVFSSFHMVASDKGLALVNRIADMPALMLDGRRLHQIIFNLVANAVKFTDEGSVTVSALYDGANLELSVADTGCGIPPDALKRILDPFARVQDATHSSYKDIGTGLGLSICNRLVEAMGGRIVVDSEPGKGSVFKVCIPKVAVCKDEAWLSVESHPQSAASQLPKRVLVVDDSPVNRKVLSALLKKAGVSTSDHACDGKEALLALDAAVKSGSPYDMVVSDYWMPNMNGRELIEALRADSRYRDLRVYLVTADAEFRDNLQSEMFTGVILKPLTYGKLEAILHSNI